MHPICLGIATFAFETRKSGDASAATFLDSGHALIDLNPDTTRAYCRHP